MSTTSCDTDRVSGRLLPGKAIATMALMLTTAVLTVDALLPVGLNRADSARSHRRRGRRDLGLRKAHSAMTMTTAPRHPSADAFLVITGQDLARDEGPGGGVA